MNSGLAAYAEQQEYLLGWLSEWRSETEFDSHFGEGGEAPAFVMAYSPETFILGTLSGGRRDFWLDLCQHMARLKLVDIERREDGLVWYRANPSPPASSASLRFATRRSAAHRNATSN